MQPRHAEDGQSKLPRTFCILYTIAIYAAFVQFGLCRGLYGPTLGELQLITGADPGQMASLFMWLGAGGILGGLAFGYLFDRLASLPVFSLALVMLGALTAAIPWCPGVALLLAACAGQAFCYMGVAVGCNVMIIRLWRHRGNPALLVMHVLYPFGLFIAPIVCHPFLSSPSIFPMSSTNDDISNNGSLISHEDINNLPCHQTVNQMYRYCNYTGVFQKNSTFQNNIVAPEVRFKSQIYKTYLIVGMLSEVIAIFFILVYSKCRNYEIYIQKQTVIDTPGIKNQQWVKFLSWTLFLVLNSCVGGVEIIYIVLLFTFANEHIGMDKDQSSQLVTVAFAAYGGGRLLLLLITQYVHIYVILPLTLVIALVANVAISYYIDTNPLVLWIGSAIFYMTISSAFLSGIMMARDYLQVNGLFTSTYLAAYTVGMMTWPTLTSYKIKTDSPEWFTHVVTALISTSLIITLGLCMLRVAIRERKVPELRINGDFNTEQMNHLDETEAAPTSVSHDDLSYTLALRLRRQERNVFNSFGSLQTI